MEEKIKIISDGKIAEVYVDGKKVMCTDMELHFIGHSNQNPMITVDARWRKTTEDGKIGTSTEGIKINC